MFDSIKKAFQLFGKALKLFCLLAVFNVVTNIVNLLIVSPPGTTALAIGQAYTVIAVTILVLLIAIFVAGGALAYIRDLIKAGSANLAQFLGNGKKYFLRLIGLTVVSILIFAAIGVVFFLLSGALGAGLKVVMTIIMVVVLLAAAILLFLPAYALVANELGVVSSIKKGVIICGRNFFGVLALTIIMLLIAIGVILAASLITGIFSLFMRTIASYAAAVLMGIANAVIAVLINIAFMDFYLKKSA